MSLRTLWIMNPYEKWNREIVRQEVINDSDHDKTTEVMNSQ